MRWGYFNQPLFSKHQIAFFHFLIWILLLSWESQKSHRSPRDIGQLSSSLRLLNLACSFCSQKGCRFHIAEAPKGNVFCDQVSLQIFTFNYCVACTCTHTDRCFVFSVQEISCILNSFYTPFYFIFLPKLLSGWPESSWKFKTIDREALHRSPHSK